MINRNCNFMDDRVKRSGRRRSSSSAHLDSSKRKMALGSYGSKIEINHPSIAPVPHFPHDSKVIRYCPKGQSIGSIIINVYGLADIVKRNYREMGTKNLLL